MQNNLGGLEKKADEELMELYVTGNNQAFEVIYERFAGRVFNYLRSRTGSERESQDLTQETFLKFHRSRFQYNRMLPLAPWIFAITRSVFLDSRKKKKVESQSALEHIEQHTETKESKSNSSLELINALEGPQKQVVSLRVFDEATFEEIAMRLATTPENARQIFSRAVRKLKAMIKGGGNL